MIKITLISLMTMLLSGCTILRPDAYPKKEKKIILTFDDGPAPDVSEPLLDVLDKRGVRAAFCYIGQNIEEHPETVTRAIDSGHMIILHSYDHALKSLASKKALLEETKACIQLINSLPSQTSPNLEYFRPPLGIKTPAVNATMEAFDLKEAYVTLFIYDASTGPDGAPDLMEKLRLEVSRNKGGAIVLHEMRYQSKHDKQAVDKTWLPTEVDAFIEWAHTEGYTFTLFN